MKATIVFAAMCLAGAVQAQEAPVTHEVEDTFDNVAFAVESAIIGAGLVIDHVSHTGEMLERTRADVGSDKVLFTQADVFTFCSSIVSRQVMEADLSNVQHCPYGIFVYETPDPAFEAARAALTEEWNRPAAFVGAGGSIPVAGYFKTILGMDAMLIGFGRDDDQIHSPNEKYDLECFHKGIRSWARVLARIA